MSNYLKDALLKKTAYTMPEDVPEWVVQDMIEKGYQNQLTPDEVKAIDDKDRKLMSTVGKASYDFETPLEKDRNSLLRKLIKRKYGVETDTSIGGKPASINQYGNTLNRRLIDMASRKFPLTIDDVKSAQEGMNVSSTMTRGYAPTGLGWGATALGGAGVGGAAGTGIAALLGKDKLTGGLIGAGLGGIAAPLALLAYGKAKGGYYGPKQSYTVNQ
jgi:hypothetical protein